jgi:hypothetical protein
MQITLELNTPEDETLLLPLLQRLGIHYAVKKEPLEKVQQPRRKIYAHRFVVDSIELPTREELYDR